MSGTRLSNELDRQVAAHKEMEAGAYVVECARVFALKNTKKAGLGLESSRVRLAAAIEAYDAIIVRNEGGAG